MKSTWLLDATSSTCEHFHFRCPFCPVWRKWRENDDAVENSSSSSRMVRDRDYTYWNQGKRIVNFPFRLVIRSIEYSARGSSEQKIEICSWLCVAMWVGTRQQDRRRRRIFPIPWPVGKTKNKKQKNQSTAGIFWGRKEGPSGPSFQSSHHIPDNKPNNQNGAVQIGEKNFY